MFVNAGLMDHPAHVYYLADMASSSRKAKKSKKKQFAGEPYELLSVKLADHCYIDNEELRAFRVGLFTGKFKDLQQRIWTITLMPQELHQMHIYQHAMELYRKLGLQAFFQLPICGVDIKRVHQLLTTMDEEGNGRVEDQDENELSIRITEEMIGFCGES